MLGLSIFNTVIAQTYPTNSWRDHADTTWYNEIDSAFNISSPEALAGLSLLVEQGNSFSSKTINLVSNIDLDNYLWEPIGYDEDFPFAGTVEGNDYTISNVWITDMNRDFLGLFGQTIGAAFYNIKLDNVNMEDIGSNSGALVANIHSNGIIKNCHATNVDIKVLGSNIGGLNGRIFTNSSIKNSSFSGRVEGAYQVGGLSAFVWDNSQILSSFSQGEVHGKYIVGGLVGFGTTPFEENREVIIEDSYSRSHVFATDAFGKAGGIYGWAPATVIMKNVYSTGKITGQNSVGALIGQARDILIENGYFDIESSELTEPIGKHEGLEQEVEGMETSDMTTTSFANLLNDNTTNNPWLQEDLINDGYPHLGHTTLSAEDFLAEELALKLYPATVDQEFYIYATAELVSYNIYNILGQIVESGILNNGPEYRIPATNLKTGVHIIEVQSKTQRLSKKFIKR